MRFLPSPRTRRPALAVGLTLAGIAVTGAGCGQDEGRPIPTGAARDLVARFDEVKRRVDARACNDVREDSLPAIQKEIDGLPANVDKDVRSTLEDGVGRLKELIEADCVEPPKAAPQETTTPEPDPQPQEDPTPTPDPEPEPTPEPDPEPTPTPEPDPGGGGSNGGGNGGGGGDSGGGNGKDGGGDSGAAPPDGGGTDPTGGTTDPGSTGGTTPRSTREAPA